jgi:hypothetical protein
MAKRSRSDGISEFALALTSLELCGQVERPCVEDQELKTSWPHF